MKQNSFAIEGNIINIYQNEVYEAQVVIESSKIKSISRTGDFNSEIKRFILPGFIDSHVHIESSMVVPSEFARIATIHGTVATVSDPHEIANVCGVDGVKFMIENGKQVPFKFNFGAPSCVPATVFETAGAQINSNEIKNLLERKDVRYLSEMMNFPGVLCNDTEVMKKISVAHSLNKPVDGHAPGLRGNKAKQYIDAGITTDHECFTREEALEKIKFGMKIIIREGSAAKNFEALIDLLNDYPDMIMFCSDDKHPDNLVDGHINTLCKRAIAKGIDIFKILKAACINPVEHYKLNVGTLRVGDPADFIVVEDLQNFRVLETYVDGELVSKNGKTCIISVQCDPINQFNCNEITARYLEVPFRGEETIPVIEALDGQLITNKIYCKPKIKAQNIVSDPLSDINKIVVVNRYKNAPVAKTFVKNFGLKEGAIGSSVAHDSHNIIAVGVDDTSIAKAINIIIKEKGGISCVNAKEEMVLPLPVAGLMSNEDGYKVAYMYTALDEMAKANGAILSAPFMTLSFMALLVIPHLKLSDLGLFDGDVFELINR